MQVHDVLLAKPRQYLVDSLLQNLDALLVRVRNHEAVHMNQGHFVSSHAGCVIVQFAQELNRIYWKVHVKVIGSLECLFILVMLFVHLLYGFSSAHVPALHPVLNAIDLAVLY